MILFLIWNNSGHMNESSKGRRLGIVMKNHHLCCRVRDQSMFSSELLTSYFWQTINSLLRGREKLKSIWLISLILWPWVFSSVLYFPASFSELKWEELTLKWYELISPITSSSTVEVKTLQAQISQEYSFSICQDKIPTLGFGSCCKM